MIKDNLKVFENEKGFWSNKWIRNDKEWPGSGHRISMDKIGFYESSPFKENSVTSPTVKFVQFLLLGPMCGLICWGLYAKV